MNITVACFHCGQNNSYLSPLGRKEECPKCHSDAHVCKNCEHFDPGAYNSCREPQADFVSECERANFCDYFTAKTPGAAAAKAKDLKAAAEALFKKKT